MLSYTLLTLDCTSRWHIRYPVLPSRSVQIRAAQLAISISDVIKKKSVFGLLLRTEETRKPLTILPGMG